MWGRLAEDYAAEVQPVISTYFSRFRVSPQALTAADLSAQPVLPRPNFHGQPRSSVRLNFGGMQIGICWSSSGKHP
jgi:hypothetical protein